MSLPMPEPGQRVCVTLPFAELRAMQVCAVADATDEEILAVCNEENRQLVAGGWHAVIRNESDCAHHDVDTSAMPGDCVECKGHKHIIAICM